MFHRDYETHELCKKHLCVNRIYLSEHVTQEFFLKKFLFLFYFYLLSPLKGSVPVVSFDSTVKPVSKDLICSINCLSFISQHDIKLRISLRI